MNGIPYIISNICYIYIYIYIYIFSWLRRHTHMLASSRTRVRDLSGPLINFIKWVLKYYLEVILYNCV